MKLISGMTLLLVGGSTLAGSLSAPVSIPSAKILPKGVRTFTYKGVSATPDYRYNNSGSSTSLADKMNSELSFKNLLDSTQEAHERALIEAKMVELGISETDSLGEITGQVNAEVQSNVPILAWGLTSKLMGAVAVPIHRSSINIDTGVVQKNEALHQRLRESMEIAPGKQVEIVNKLASPISQSAKEKGYKPIANEKATELGDVKLVGYYKLFDIKHSALTLGTDITLPTGREQDPDKVIDLPPGDGQTDVGLNVTYDYYNGGFSFSAHASYTHQFADTVERRVPFSAASSLSADKDSNIDRKLGDQFTSQVGLRYNKYGFGGALGYSFAYKQGDSYSGSMFEQSRYDLLAVESIQHMQAALINLNYSTFRLFKRGAFPVPMTMSLTHTMTTRGKNVVKDPFTTVDVSLFF